MMLKNIPYPLHCMTLAQGHLKEYFQFRGRPKENFLFRGRPKENFLFRGRPKDHNSETIHRKNLVYML